MQVSLEPQNRSIAKWGSDNVALASALCSLEGEATTVQVLFSVAQHGRVSRGREVKSITKDHCRNGAELTSIAF